MNGRYDKMFQRLAERGEIAFVPFTVLGDPNRETSLEVLRALIAGGADALELGIPFSDPVADGPTIQAADNRALSSGVTKRDAWEIVSKIRQETPEIPIGLLVYANLVVHEGLDSFYAAATQSGVDSVLVADVPTLEARPFCDAARTAGIDPVMIAPPNASTAQLKIIASSGGGYTYVITRRGVTGADEDVQLNHSHLLDTLSQHNAPPSLFGFGISKPEHVKAARSAGAAGAISGSAVVSRIEIHLSDTQAMTKDIQTFVAEMKAATLPGEVE